MALTKSKNKGGNKGWANLIPIKPGETRNPNGRPVGQRNYRTLYRIALERIGETEGLTGDQVEEIMAAVGLMKALKGDFFFHKDINDRIHGKPKERFDLGSGGKSLADLLVIAASNGVRRKKDSKAPRKNKG